MTVWRHPSGDRGGPRVPEAVGQPHLVAGLISGVLMTVMAFWTAGQLLFEKAYSLLVFAGVWAVMEGITSITRAFAVRRLHEALKTGVAAARPRADRALGS
jgi:hypothetical protein